jgi:hypothetical protein
MARSLERTNSISSLKRRDESILHASTFHAFSVQEIQKYRKWFSLMDADNTATVDIGELGSVMLSTGILNNQKEVADYFDMCDLDNSGGITFDEFLNAIAFHVKASKIKIEKLNRVVRNGSILSKETVLSQERRMVLMKHIVDNSTMRARQLDIAFDGAVARGHAGRRKMKRQLSIGSVIEKNEAELDSSSESVMYISEIVRKHCADLAPNDHTNQALSRSQFAVLPPVEMVLSPAALALVNQPHWKHHSIAGQSDTEVQPCLKKL